MVRGCGGDAEAAGGRRDCGGAERLDQGKGYDFETAEQLARGVFEEFQAPPGGLSIEERVKRILTKEEFEREYGC